MTCLASKQEEETGGLLLATGSQDSFVRLWKVERRKEEVEEKEVNEELAVTEQVVKLGKEDWLVVVESVLAGSKDLLPFLTSGDCSRHTQATRGEYTVWLGEARESCSQQVWTGGLCNQTNQPC